MDDIGLQTLQEARTLLEEAKRYTVVTHVNPDTDTLATGLGVYALLRRYTDKGVEIVNASSDLPHFLDFLKGYDRIKQKITYDDSLIIACDAGSLDRLGFDDLERRVILNIDHHQSNTMYGTLNVVSARCASASEVAFRLFKGLGYVLPEASEAFYAALLSDTRFFTVSGLDKRVFEVALEMIRAGAQPARVAYNLTRRRSLASIRLLERALKSLSLHHDAQVATMCLRRIDFEASGAKTPDTDMIAEYGVSLATVEIGVLLIEQASGVKVSLRSKRIDVSQIAERFGGGGHVNAAGFTLEGEVIDTIRDKLADVLKTELERV